MFGLLRWIMGVFGVTVLLICVIFGPMVLIAHYEEQKECGKLTKEYSNVRQVFMHRPGQYSIQIEKDHQLYLVTGLGRVRIYTDASDTGYAMRHASMGKETRIGISVIHCQVSTDIHINPVMKVGGGPFRDSTGRSSAEYNTIVIH